jgi:hypothetical protein
LIKWQRLEFSKARYDNLIQCAKSRKILSLIVVEFLQLSPKYLHTNSTSHTWPFSAIAELIGRFMGVKTLFLKPSIYC